MILRYLKYQDDFDYMTLTQYIESYSQIVGSLSETDGASTSNDVVSLANDKMKVIKQLQSVRESIDQLSEKVFKKDIDLLNFVGSFQIDEENSYKVRPEDWAT